MGLFSPRKTPEFTDAALSYISLEDPTYHKDVPTLLPDASLKRIINSRQVRPVPLPKTSQDMDQLLLFPAHARRLEVLAREMMNENRRRTTYRSPELVLKALRMRTAVWQGIDPGNAQLLRTYHPHRLVGMLIAGFQAHVRRMGMVASNDNREYVAARGAFLLEYALDTPVIFDGEPDYVDHALRLHEAAKAECWTLAAVLLWNRLLLSEEMRFLHDNARPLTDLTQSYYTQLSKMAHALPGFAECRLTNPVRKALKEHLLPAQRQALDPTLLLPG